MIEREKTRFIRGKIWKYMFRRYQKPPHSARSFGANQMFDRTGNTVLFEIIAGHRVDNNGYLKNSQVDKEKLRKAFIAGHPRIFEDPSDLEESRVNKLCEEAKKLGIADSKICEIKKVLAGGERPSDRETSIDRHEQDRNEALEQQGN